MDDHPEVRLPIPGDISRPGKPRKTPPTRTASRRAPTLMDLSHRLTPRDYTIAHLLSEHTTLTTTQLTAALFTNETTGRHRLLALRRLRFIDRFIRSTPLKSRPVCWVPGPLSARYVAMANGEQPPPARAVIDRAERASASPKLDHLLGVNDFFVKLLAGSRAGDGRRLLRWWSERTATPAYGRKIQPDGHGVWADGDRWVGFFLEYDTGTEGIGRLVSKLLPYQQLAAAGGPDYPVLYVLQSPRREENLHQRLAAGITPAVVVATTNLVQGADPAAAVWRAFGGGQLRRMVDLPSSHGQPGPINPGAPQPQHDPLWLLRGIPAAADE